MRVSRRLVACVLALIAAGAVPVLAQTYHGGLRGLVREQGAVVPGAGVDLINEATNVSRHTQTNNVGEYAFINVDPATYTVKVTMQGFKTIENKGVRIGTQQFVTLDFALEVGNLDGGGHGREPGHAARDLERIRGQHPRQRDARRPCPRRAATRSSSRPSRPA